MSKFYLTAIAIAMAWMPAFTQTDTVRVKLLDEVVVTGQYEPQDAANSVYQVRVIKKERIEKSGAVKLQDILMQELNFRFTQDLATGGSNMEMMGLSGQNVKILLDGVPVTGRQGTSNEVDVNQLDVRSIERIEIVEGPMSVLYGADALAGVINIITRKAARNAIQVGARLQEETIGSEYGIDRGIHNQHINASWSKNKWSVTGSAGRNYFGGWRGQAEDRELEWHRKTQVPGNIQGAYHSSKFNIRYRFDGLFETIFNPGSFAGTEAIDQDYISRRFIHQVTASLMPNSKVSAEVIGSHTNYSREIYSTVVKPNGDVRLAQGRGMQDISRFNGTVSRGTVFYKISKPVSLQAGYDINLESGDGERLKEGIQKVNDFALFISSEIKPLSWLKLRPGLRTVRNSVYQAPPVIPSFNTKITWGKAFNLRLAFARGFRSPSIRELYFYFFDASHQIEGNTGLKAETSSSFTGSLEWTGQLAEGQSVRFTMGGFFNDITDRIDIGQSASNPNIYTYINIARFKTSGVNLNAAFTTRRLHITAGAAYTGRYNSLSEEDPELPRFRRSADANTSVAYQFFKPALTLNIFYKIYGKIPAYQLIEDNGGIRTVLVETEGYSWADFAFTKKIGESLSLNGGLKNIFNVTRINSGVSNGGAHTQQGARPIGYGRSFFMALSFNWNKSTKR